MTNKLDSDLTVSSGFNRSKGGNLNKWISHKNPDNLREINFTFMDKSLRMFQYRDEIVHEFIYHSFHKEAAATSLLTGLQENYGD